MDYDHSYETQMQAEEEALAALAYEQLLLEERWREEAEAS